MRSIIIRADVELVKAPAEALEAADPTSYLIDEAIYEWGYKEGDPIYRITEHGKEMLKVGPKWRNHDAQVDGHK